MKLTTIELCALNFYDYIHTRNMIIVEFYKYTEQIPNLSFMICRKICSEFPTTTGTGKIEKT